MVCEVGLGRFGRKQLIIYFSKRQICKLTAEKFRPPSGFGWDSHKYGGQIDLFSQICDGNWQVLRIFPKSQTLICPYR